MSRMPKQILLEDEDYEIIFRPWITRNGVRVYPPRGLRVWPLRVPKRAVD